MGDLKQLLVEYPSILGYSMKNLKSKFNFYFGLCGFTKEEARKMIVKEPRLITAGVRTGLLPRMHFFVKELKIPLAILREIVKKNPFLLLGNVDQILRPKLKSYLNSSLGMDVAKVHKLLKRFPQFVNYHLENKILPMQQYFCEDLQFSNTEYANILLKYPRLITYSLVGKIKHVVGYLRYELEMDAHQVKRILYQAPQVTSFNTDYLNSKVIYLKKTMHWEKEEMKKVLTGMPNLLLCSIEKNIVPKLEYLQSVGLESKEVSDMILLLPTLLGYSLEKRIKPRMNRLLEANIHPSAITVAIPMVESYFESWLEGKCLRAAQKKRKKNPRLSPVLTSTSKIEKETNTTRGGRIQHWTRPRRT